MKVFVSGFGGQLGYDVVYELIERGHVPIASDIKENVICPCEYVKLDITNSKEVEKVLFDVQPEVVIHCAAWTAVDLAEDEDKQELVHNINVLGTQNIAKACKDLNCKMIYISTDYVFDGQGDKPWQADCQSFSPLNVYGASKLGGEIAVKESLEKYFIVRIAWVFGVNGNNFVKTMLKLGKTLKEIRVVNDQIGTPTYTYDLAKLLVDMSQTEKYGCYHATNEGEYISWYDFAREIFKVANCDINVIPVTTEEYGVSKARRPFNSRLDKEKLSIQGFNRLPHWKDALRRYIQTEQKNNK